MRVTHHALVARRSFKIGVRLQEVSRFPVARLHQQATRPLRNVSACESMKVPGSESLINSIGSESRIVRHSVCVQGRLGAARWERLERRRSFFVWSASGADR